MSGAGDGDGDANAELARFAARVQDGAASAGALAGSFSPSAPLTLARAPGRLDVMGGIADYSGSLVLELPIREAALAAAQRASDGLLVVTSLPAGDANARSVSLPLAALVSGEAQTYDGAHAYFRKHPERHWAVYLAGVLLVLRREKGVELGSGLRLLISSSVPEGKGVSSSAAIEVAAMQAVAAELGATLDPVELALLCQKVENLVVGAPCGVMDQMTSACGREGCLLELLCQPASILGQRSLPEGLSVFGIDSGVRHAVTGADYGQVRVGAFMGYRLIAELEKFAVERTRPSEALAIADPRYGGYLANISVSEWQARYESALPEALSGAEFLERYAGTTDRVTSVEASRSYPVRAATGHPVHEHFRVRTFAELLARDPEARSAELLGELMYQSHQSYSACGLGSQGTDQLVALVREEGPRAGLFGAKITGGGSGGTVAVLARADAGPIVERVAARYAEQSGLEPYVFSGSSPGALQFGVYRTTRSAALERVR